MIKTTVEINEIDTEKTSFLTFLRKLRAGSLKRQGKWTNW